MPSPFRFLSLPPELRHEVYKHYSFVEGGYVCPADSLAGRLRRADGGPIHMTLMFTCRQVHAEINGMAFRLNTVSFATMSSTHLRRLAARLDFTIRELQKIREGLCALAGPAMTDQVHAEFSITYPQFIPLLDAIRAGDWDPWRIRLSFPDGISYDETPSLYHSFCKKLLQSLLQKCPDSIPMMDQYRTWANRFVASRSGDAPTPHDLARRELQPWEYSTNEEITCLQGWLRILGNWFETLRQVPMPRRYSADGFNYRFSAASAAILFLSRLPVKSRMQIRNIILIEDRESVACPESHAEGLIPFCRENDALRIVRRVDLWRNVLQYDPHNTRENRGASRTIARREPLNSCRIIWNVSQWMVEASSLSAAGMPEASFTLVFDASSSPLQATQLFESVVQRGASWQDAWTKFQGQRDIMREANTRMFPGLMFTKFPCILRDVTAKRSIIKCNFDVGEAWSIDTVKEWADARWTTDFSNVIWEIRPPLPDWQKLVEDNLLPNESSERRRKGKRKWRDYSYQLPT